jgi:hypothetical protein
MKRSAESMSVVRADESPLLRAHTGSRVGDLLQPRKDMALCREPRDKEEGYPARGSVV